MSTIGTPLYQDRCIWRPRTALLVAVGTHTFGYIAATVGLALVGGCSATSSAAPTPATVTVTAAPAAAVPTTTSAKPTISASDAATWPAKWCSVQPGATVAALDSVMGPSTGRSDGQESWSYREYGFYAFFAVDGTVRQLDINQSQLTDAEKAALTCAAIRTAK